MGLPMGALTGGIMVHDMGSCPMRSPMGYPMDYTTDNPMGYLVDYPTDVTTDTTDSPKG